MAYLKGGTYVDGDLYIDGAIKVRSIETIGGDATVSLDQGNSSVRKYSLLKFTTDPANARAGAVSYSQIFVEEDPNSPNTLFLYFGTPYERSEIWNPVSGNEAIKEVKLDHPVSYLKVSTTYHSHSGSNETPINLVLDPATRTWSYNEPN